jgi:hypothetical protein
MPVFEPAVQPSNVGVAGTIVEVPIHENYRGRRIARIVVVKTAGSGATHDVLLTSDAAAADAALAIAEWTAEALPLDDDNHGTGFVWEYADSEGSVYVKLTPNAGADNNYRVRIFVEA